MVFLGCLFEQEKEKYYLEKSRCGISNAVNGYQWSLIDGLNSCLELPIKIINVLPVGVFPFQYKELLLKSCKWKCSGVENYQVGCINVPFIKQYQRYRTCKRILKEIQDKDILIYSTYLPFLKAIYKLDSSYKITIIVTDLPEYYDLGKRNLVVDFFRKRNNRKIYKYMKRVDKFVILTEQMREPLQIGNRSYCVVEGICKGEPLISNSKDTLEEKIILYTGTLHKRFGIDNLLKAFSLIKEPEYRLWICGNGDMEKVIKSAVEEDSRITFWGYIPKEKIIECQKKATVLINPRQNNEQFTKYSFPSKTMEYMLSGKPVLMYKLDGIPNEYDEFLCYFEDNSIECLRKKIVEICELSKEERELIGKKAQKFVLEEKNYIKQARKILSMCDIHISFE